MCDEAGAQEGRSHEVHALAVADVVVARRAGLEHVGQQVLPRAVAVLEQRHVRVGTREVFSARRVENERTNERK